MGFFERLNRVLDKPPCEEVCRKAPPDHRDELIAIRLQQHVEASERWALRGNVQMADAHRSFARELEILQEPLFNASAYTKEEA